MMTNRFLMTTLGPKLAAAIVFTLAAAAGAQTASPAADAAKNQPSVTPANRAQAYFHLALGGAYEDDALTEGRTDEVNRAIEEYKVALNADPGSAQLSVILADLYFRAGHVREAEAAVRVLLKNAPDSIEARRLLGRIYLRRLGEGELAGATAPGGANILDQAITEFEKIVALDPKSLQDHMVLGQLYTARHQADKAEAEFKAAEALEPESEEVVLNLARLYAQSGDPQHAVKTIEAIPAGSRSPKMEMALGALYDQLKQPQEAIAAYRRAADLGPEDLQTLDTLAHALLTDEQFDEALKQYQILAEADPENAEALVRIAEIERRQGKFDDALVAIRKARKIDPKSLDAGFNEGMLLDILGRFDEAAQTYQEMADATAHANGAYTDEEKANRGIFLERLAGVYLEQNKIEPAVAAYQKMVELGGKYAESGYQGQVEAYHQAHEFDKAVEVSRKAAAAEPQDSDMKLMLAGELADNGKLDEALAISKSLLDGAKPAAQRGVWCSIAQMSVRLRRWKEAGEALDKAEALSSKKEERAYVLFLRGTLAERQKHIEPAEQFFRQSLDIDPDSAMVLNYFGYMWADKGVKLPDALKLIRKAVDQEPMNGAYLDSLGWVYFKMGEYELSEDNLRKAADRTRTDPTVHMHLGDLYEKTGRIRLAAAQWEQALAEFAKSLPVDIEPGDVARVQKKLDSARVKLAKEDHSLGQVKAQ